MPRLLIALLVAGGVVAHAAGAVSAQDPPQPPANDDCMACHSDPAAARADGSKVAVDPASFGASKHGPLACVACHTDLKSLTEYPHGDKLARVTCATCHDAVGLSYDDSIHARARERSGLLIAPTCSSCHGTHDIKGRIDPSSRIFKQNVAAMCGTCHVGIIEKYDVGIHAAGVKQGNPLAPACNDCHTTHAIQRADTDAWRLSVTGECGTCHTAVVESFGRTFHGKVTQLGFGSVAACADCHGSHDIRPKSDPASMVAPGNLVQTCSKCHVGVSAGFIQYDPHPNPKDYDRSPVLWWANIFYWWLIPGCFVFFALHSALWFNRSWRDRRTGDHP